MHAQLHVHPLGVNLHTHNQESGCLQRTRTQEVVSHTHTHTHTHTYTHTHTHTHTHTRARACAHTNTCTASSQENQDSKYLQVDPGEALLAGELKVGPHQQVEQSTGLPPRGRQLGVTAPQDLHTRTNTPIYHQWWAATVMQACSAVGRLLSIANKQYCRSTLFSPPCKPHKSVLKRGFRLL